MDNVMKDRREIQKFKLTITANGLQIFRDGELKFQMLPLSQPLK